MPQHPVLADLLMSSLGPPQPPFSSHIPGDPEALGRAGKARWGVGTWWCSSRPDVRRTPAATRRPRLRACAWGAVRQRLQRCYQVQARATCHRWDCKSRDKVLGQRKRLYSKASRLRGGDSCPKAPSSLRVDVRVVCLREGGAGGAEVRGDHQTRHLDVSEGLRTAASPARSVTLVHSVTWVWPDTPVRPCQSHGHFVPPLYLPGGARLR